MAKNYTEQGGEKTVIGGKLTFEPGAAVENMPMATANTVGGVKQCEYVENSDATTIASLKEDLNGLLAKLRTAGILSNTPS